MGERYRIGLIVPSSNTTMETELPELFRCRAEVAPEAFTFHSSRVRMQRVTEDELTRMVADSDRAAVELADAQVDVMAYACLVAIMAQGPGYHEVAERRLGEVAAANGCLAPGVRGWGGGSPIPVVSSAGALVRSIYALGASKVALVTPYLKPLTALVAEYLADAGIEVVDAGSLEIAKNLEVAEHDPMLLPEIARRLDLRRAEAVVLSACVQLPSLPAIQRAQDELGLPVLSAAVATAYEILDGLGLEPTVPDAGALLAGLPGRPAAPAPA